MTRILLVDDRSENLENLSALLTAHDFTVETAGHGDEALVLARKDPPDLVISDLLMPLMDGYTLLRHWRSEARLATIPFIVYTATHTDPADEQLALTLGADAFIPKPADPEAFMSRVRSVLDSERGSRQPSPSAPNTDEKKSLELYDPTLIRKLEEKTLQLEEANRALKQDIREREESENALQAPVLRAQRMESIGTLAGGIAHDFNNILAPIVMGVSYLKRVESREKVLAVIENIEKSADRGAALVRQVLSFTRGVEVTGTPLPVENVVREVGSIVTSTFPKDIGFDTLIPEGLWTVDGDATQLAQALLNLCSNARDAMPDGGKLLITAENVVIDEHQGSISGHVTPGRYVKIEVADEGRGIPPEIRDRIFEPFYTTKKTGIGSGLGLSTALGIVRSHGGFIDLASATAGETTFSVYLPAGTEDGAGESPVTEPPAVRRGNGELILMVDDEPSILEIVQETLDSYGYRTLVAEDGARALELYADHGDEISLVITDMKMPRMDGAALIAELKRINPDVTIIATSGLIGGSYDSSGAAAFLKKPFSADQLLVLLQSVLTEDRP